jgi:hypothetical protein
MDDVQPQLPQVGWVAAAAKDGEPWIAPWSGTCPEQTLDGIRYVHPQVVLGCYGGEELTLEGKIRACDVGGAGDIEPAWLYQPSCELVPFDYLPGLIGGLVLRHKAGVELPDERGTAVRVVGHFDDSAAQRCSAPAPTGVEETPPEIVVLQCRLQFVVTSVVVLDG